MFSIELSFQFVIIEEEPTKIATGDEQARNVINASIQSEYFKIRKSIRQFEMEKKRFADKIYDRNFYQVNPQGNGKLFWPPSPATLHKIDSTPNSCC